MKRRKYQVRDMLSQARYSSDQVYQLLRMMQDDSRKTKIELDDLLTPEENKEHRLVDEKFAKQQAIFIHACKTYQNFFFRLTNNRQEDKVFK